MVGPGVNIWPHLSLATGRTCQKWQVKTVASDSYETGQNNMVKWTCVTGETGEYHNYEEV